MGSPVASGCPSLSAQRSRAWHTGTICSRLRKHCTIARRRRQHGPTLRYKSTHSGTMPNKHNPQAIVPSKVNSHSHNGRQARCRSPLPRCSLGPRNRCTGGRLRRSTPQNRPGLVPRWQHRASGHASQDTAGAKTVGDVGCAFHPSTS